MSRVRLVAVLGYSDGRSELHDVCLQRLRRAELEARPEDVVLLSGWGRKGSNPTEAELMAGAWRGPRSELVLHRGARSTVANIAGAARLALRVGADEVVVVTSAWHAPRAGMLLRVALAGTGTAVRIVRTDDEAPPGARLREMACWTLVPAGAAALVATLNPRAAGGSRPAVARRTSRT